MVVAVAIVAIEVEEEDETSMTAVGRVLLPKETAREADIPWRLSETCPDVVAVTMVAAVVLVGTNLKVLSLVPRALQLPTLPRLVEVVGFSREFFEVPEGAAEILVRRNPLDF